MKEKDKQFAKALKNDKTFGFRIQSYKNNYVLDKTKVILNFFTVCYLDLVYSIVLLSRPNFYLVGELC